MIVRRSTRLFIVGRVLIFGIDTPGYASLVIAVLLMGGIQLCRSASSASISAVFLEVKGRPIYVVDYVVDGTTAPAAAAAKPARRAKP